MPDAIPSYPDFLYSGYGATFHDVPAVPPTFPYPGSAFPPPRVAPKPQSRTGPRPTQAARATALPVYQSAVRSPRDLPSSEASMPATPRTGPSAQAARATAPVYPFVTLPLSSVPAIPAPPISAPIAPVGGFAAYVESPSLPFSSFPSYQDAFARSFNDDLFFDQSIDDHASTLSEGVQPTSRGPLQTRGPVPATAQHPSYPENSTRHTAWVPGRYVGPGSADEQLVFAFSSY